MSTSFQIAGCFGSSLFMGVLSFSQNMAIANGSIPTSALPTGFQSASLMAAAIAIVGFILSIFVARSKPVRTVGEPSDAVAAGGTHSLASLMIKDAWAIPLDATVLDAVELFMDKGISGAPMLDGSGALVGFVSDGDVMRMLSKQSPLFQNPWSFIAEQDDDQFDETIKSAMRSPVMDIATRNVISVDLDDDLGTVC